MVGISALTPDDGSLNKVAKDFEGDFNEVG
jgi:hypothetical protein